MKTNGSQAFWKNIYKNEKAFFLRYFKSAMSINTSQKFIFKILVNKAIWKYPLYGIRISIYMLL